MSKNRESNFISVVCYVNEKTKNIEAFLEVVNNSMVNNFLNYEIICVNDSNDREALSNQIKEINNRIGNANVTIVNMSFKQGIESAMRAGIDLAIGDFVYEFDTTDIDYEAGLIIELYKQSLKGYDIVNAVPRNAGSLSSKTFYKMINSNSNSEQKLQTQTFRIISRRGLNRVTSISNSIVYRKATYAYSGMNIYSMIYDSISNKEKKLVQTRSERFDLAINSLLLFTNVAYKFSFILACIFLCSTSFIAIYALIIFMGGHPIEGWTTTMLFLAFSFFGIFSLLAIVVKYLSVLVEMNFKKQNYLINSIERLTK